MPSSHTAPPPPAGTPALGASLRRASDDRLLLGVCGGIARATNTSPLAIRLATLLLGCVLLPLIAAIYAGIALIVPRDDGSALIGNGPRDGRDIVVVLLYLMVAAPLVLGAADTSFFGGLAAWPALLTASIVAFVLAVWRPKAMLGAAGEPAADRAPWSPSTTATPATAETSVPAGPNFVKPDPPSPADAPQIRRRSIALPILSVLALIPALFVVLVALGVIHNAWSAWSVMVAVLAVGAAGGAVAVALLRPSYLGAGFLVVLAAILGAGSIGLNQLGPVIDDGLGERSFLPTSTGEIEPQYRLGIGQLDLDLRQLKLRPGSTTTVRAKLGFGELRIVVPKGARVVAAPGSQVPGLVSTAQRNGATAKTSASAPVIALDIEARGAEIDLLGGNAVHYENLTVLASQATGFWGTTNRTASRDGVTAGSRP